MSDNIDSVYFRSPARSDSPLPAGIFRFGIGIMKAKALVEDG